MVAQCLHLVQNLWTLVQVVAQRVGNWLGLKEDGRRGGRERRERQRERVREGMREGEKGGRMANAIKWHSM